MKRASFVAALAAAGSGIAWPVEAKSAGTLIAVSCRGTDSADLAEDDIATALRARGVSCVDSSAMSSTLHTRARLVAQRIFDGVEIDYASLSWVTTQYAAPRVLLATLELHDRELPYGEFTVHDMRAVLSARCFNVRQKALVGSGAVTRSAKGEDDTQVRFDVIKDAAESLAKQIAGSLTSA